MLHNGETAEIINGESFITYGIIIFEMVYCQLELCHNILLKKKNYVFQPVFLVWLSSVRGAEILGTRLPGRLCFV